MRVVDHGLVPPPEWDSFVSASPTAWFWHSRSWIDYTLAYRDAALHSGSVFTVRDGNDRIVAAGVALVEECELAKGELPTRVVGFGGGPVWAPAVAQDLDDSGVADALKLSFGHLSVLASAEDAAFGSTRLTSIPNDAEAHQGAVRVAALRKGWAERGGATQLLDTSQPSDEIRRRMSKGHRSAITRGLRSMSVTTTEPGDSATFSAYRRMHLLAAGRSTRPARTWDLMEDWLSNGSGILLGARLANEWVGFSYVLISGKGAYYASAANHPDVEGEPIGHVLQWAAIEELARRGVVSYELGHQHFGTTSSATPSPKDIAIARFKRGFGGRTAPVVEHERFWDAPTARSVLARRAADYADTLQHDAFPS